MIVDVMAGLAVLMVVAALAAPSRKDTRPHEIDLTSLLGRRKR